MKKFLLLFIMLFLLVGCGKKDENDEPVTGEVTKNEVQVEEHKTLDKDLVYDKKYVADESSERNAFSDEIYFIFYEDGTLVYSANVCYGYVEKIGTYTIYEKQGKNYIEVNIEDNFVPKWVMIIGKDTLTVDDVDEEQIVCGFAYDFVLEK